MKINRIHEIHYEGNLADVTLDVEFGPDTGERWELVEPTALVVYAIKDEVEMDYMELIDQGMIVHGFEFTEEEVRQIEGFLEKNHIRQQIKKDIQNKQ